MWFDFVLFASLIMTAIRNSPGYPSLTMTKIMTILQNIFLCSLACESCYSKSGYLCTDWSWVGIRDSQVKSGQSRLIRDAWTLCKGFFLGGGVGGRRGMFSRKKIRNLRSSNCWKCTEIVNITITLLFLYHFKYFIIASGGPFGSWGATCAPRAPPPCLRACGYGHD